MAYRLIQGDNRETLKTLADASVDAIVTDPPYGIDFLGKEWDADVGALETYQECLRVLKPGGHILAFSAARTYHHLAMTLERAGFEIRDQIMWIYSSGFPKSQDVGKNNGMPEWRGWGTALKPAHEPICLARKPMKTSIAKNVQRYGTGAINIDATRIPTDEVIVAGAGTVDTFNKFNPENNTDGLGTGVKINKDVERWQQAEGGRFPSNVIGEIPDYQKYFYCPKVNRRERHIGFAYAETNKQLCASIGVEYKDNETVLPGIGMVKDHGLRQEIEKIRGYSSNGNNHPTVKPVALMEYLIKLITPAGGTVLDPFNGSGSTGMAAVGLGFDYIGLELDPAYVEISRRRIDAWIQPDNNFDSLFEEEMGDDTDEC